MSLCQKAINPYIFRGTMTISATTKAVDISLLQDAGVTLPVHVAKLAAENNPDLFELADIPDQDGSFYPTTGLHRPPPNYDFDKMRRACFVNTLAKYDDRLEVLWTDAGREWVPSVRNQLGKLIAEYTFSETNIVPMIDLLVTALEKQSELDFTSLKLFTVTWLSFYCLEQTHTDWLANDGKSAFVDEGPDDQFFADMRLKLESGELKIGFQTSYEQLGAADESPKLLLPLVYISPLVSLPPTDKKALPLVIAQTSYLVWHFYNPPAEPLLVRDLNLSAMLFAKKMELLCYGDAAESVMVKFNRHQRSEDWFPNKGAGSPLHYLNGYLDDHDIEKQSSALFREVALDELESGEMSEEGRESMTRLFCQDIANKILYNEFIACHNKYMNMYNDQGEDFAVLMQALYSRQRIIPEFKQPEEQREIVSAARNYLRLAVNNLYLAYYGNQNFLPSYTEFQEIEDTIKNQIVPLLQAVKATGDSEEVVR
jgi:hypothetical protein